MDSPDPPETGSSAGSSAIAAESVNEDDFFARVLQRPPSRRRPRTAEQPPQANPETEDPGAGITESSDSDLGIDVADYPASMTSSIRAHVYEGGLRYHAFRDGRYAFPNDDIEQNRDDMKHAMTLMLMRGEYFYAPVGETLREGGSVYDLGTGTGIWAIELADKYPNSLIRGCDLSPIQPNYIPPNCHFVIDDLEDEWLYPEDTFDYIHVRHTLHSIRDRKTLLERCYRHLKPGGYVEFQELHYSPKCDDATLTADTPYAFRDFMTYMDAGLRALGSELNAVADLPGEMQAAGLADVRRAALHRCPIGVWPRDRRLRCCGLFMRTAIMDGLRGLAGRPLGTGLGWTTLQIEMFLVEVRKSLMDSGFHAYFPFHVVYGRKPAA
ncbi:S-adenosyl-L-methionine-dependent methyltransferase [Pleurostoma richardsiae]|uniref:S-adenosyl-L-methionine-dependent methyltransferase n=1 Tax=Pleurostoma richardsiae TaxID=41990 RepID=A0AA38R8Q3_9PEZI|nr:S-adenosyl-L-methionine-dependent methyltransferase [Pleurostoma richardsiae]